MKDPTPAAPPEKAFDARLAESAQTDSERPSNSTNCPIIGIGASAGGLAAFEEFFSALDEETGNEMAFVAVQHLDPDHHSLLTEIIQRYTRTEVHEITDGMPRSAIATTLTDRLSDEFLRNG